MSVATHITEDLFIALLGDAMPRDLDSTNIRTARRRPCGA